MQTEAPLPADTIDIPLRPVISYARLLAAALVFSSNLKEHFSTNKPGEFVCPN